MEFTELLSLLQKNPILFLMESFTSKSLESLIVHLSLSLITTDGILMISYVLFNNINQTLFCNIPKINFVLICKQSLRQLVYHNCTKVSYLQRHRNFCSSENTFQRKVNFLKCDLSETVN